MQRAAHNEAIPTLGKLTRPPPFLSSVKITKTTIVGSRFLTLLPFVRPASEGHREGEGVRRGTCGEVTKEAGESGIEVTGRSER